MSDRTTAPIFVIGYMRSGTTLLRNILATHPAIFTCRGETKYFEYRYLFRRLYPDLTDEEQLTSLIFTLVDMFSHGLSKIPENKPVGYRPETVAITEADRQHMLALAQTRLTYGGVFRAVFEHLTAQAGKQRWLEKTPQHVYFIDEILRDIPDTLFVEIVRDPRDTLASKKKRKQRIQSDTFTDEERKEKNLRWNYDPFWDSLAWRQAIRAVQKAKVAYPDRIISVRYEDLVGDTEGTTRRVCDFIDVPFVPVMVDFEQIQEIRNLKGRHNAITQTSVERWKHTLTPAEIVVCQSMCGRLMQQHEYAPAPVSWLDRVRVVPVLARSGFDLFLRLANRWRLGGWRLMFTTLDNYQRQIRRLVHR